MIVSKESLRKVVRKKRLPRSMILYLTGAVLYDLLSENGEEDSFSLMNTTYCLGYTSIGRKIARLGGQFELTRKARFNLNRMKRFVMKDPYLNAQFLSSRNFLGDNVYEVLFRKYVKGHAKKERAYRNA